MKEENAVNSKQAPPLFDNDLKQKIFLLFVTFTLTVVLGTLFSYYFQTRTSYINYRQSLVESERKIAKELFEDVTNGMDSRAYLAQVINTDLNLKSKTFDSKWSDYTQAVSSWNSKISTRKLLVKAYFYDHNDSAFSNIHVQFRRLNSRLQEVRQIRQGENTAVSQDQIEKIKRDIDNDINSINKNIGDLSSSMIIQIQKDSIGKIRSLKKYRFKDYILD